MGSTISVGHREAMRLLESHCPVGLVVDAGAWPGALCRHLESRGWGVIAIDREPTRPIEVARGSWRKADWRESSGPTFAEEMSAISVPVHDLDLECEAIPLSSGAADAVVLTEVIEHLWRDPLFALAELNRILKQDGVLVLSTPNLLSLRNRVNFVRGAIDRVIESPFVAFLKRRELGHFGHLRLYAPVELDALLTLSGFRIRFAFRSLNYHERVAIQPPSGEAGAGTGGRRAGALRKRWLKAPGDYGKAAAATAGAYLERAYPTLRSHMFVVGWKVRDVDPSDWADPRAEGLIQTNSWPATYAQL